MQRDAAGGHKLPDFNPNWPACMICKDTGVWGGGREPFHYCGCPAGWKRVHAEDSYVAEANAERQKLLDLVSK